MILALTLALATSPSAGPSLGPLPAAAPGPVQADAALEAVAATWERLLAGDDDPAWFLEHLVPASRKSEERLLMVLGMFRRDVPGGVARRFLPLSDGVYELTLYSAQENVSAIMTLSDIEAEAPHRFAFGGARLEDGDVASSGVEDGMSPEAMARFLDGWVGELAAADSFSGSVLLAKDGEVVFEKAWGLASRAFEVPNQVDTKFNLGSMNKMFTAVAIAQLAEQEKLAFDDALIEHLPDYPNPDVARRITLHQLLTHTSGMGDFFSAMFEVNWTQLRTPADHLPLFAMDPLLFEPGERFSYSNAGFLVLGLVVEAVSGEDYYDYVRKHVFEPAGMSNTDSWANDEVVPNLAIGYTRGDPRNHDTQGPVRNNLYSHRLRGGPAGGGFSTVHDLLAFATALMEGDLLDVTSLERVLGRHVAMGPGSYYGYGFGVHETLGHENLGHNGGAPGINAELAIFPVEGYVLAVMTNMDGGASNVARRMREMIARADDA